MRDTFVLRQRLAALVCLPMLAGCPGQADERPSAPVPDAPHPEAAHVGATDSAPRADAAAATRTPVAPADSAGSRDADVAVDPETRRTMPIAGDPPFIDGYNPEEAPCPSGNWCSDPAHAERLATNSGANDREDGCPIKLFGPADADAFTKDAAFSGISVARAMQARYNAHGTALARARERQEDLCCYHWFEYCSGRPILESDADVPRVAPLGVGHGWPVSTLRGDPFADVPRPVRLRAALAWLSDALDEHASVAAFARQTLELLALGAPAELLTDTQRAGLDELDHVRGCLAVARALDPELATKQPGPLAPPPLRPPTWTQLAVDTFQEGCVGETLAALRAHRAAAQTTEPTVATVLSRIEDDETRHAALAWRTVRWAIANGGPSVLTAVEEIARTMANAVETTLDGDHDDPALCEAHPKTGRLGDHERRRVARDGWREIIVPMLEGLRASAEGTNFGASAEGLRASAEDLRASAEGLRASAEGTNFSASAEGTNVGAQPFPSSTLDGRCRPLA